MNVIVNQYLEEDGWTNNFIGAHSSGWDRYVDGARLAFVFDQENGIQNAITHYFIDIKDKRVVGNKVYWKEVTYINGFGESAKEETYKDYDLDLGKRHCMDLYEAIKDLDLETLTEEDKARLGIKKIGPDPWSPIKLKKTN
jgi:hypothetical protein